MTIAMTTTQAEIFADLETDIFKLAVQRKTGILTAEQYTREREKIERQIDRLIQI